MMKTIIYFIITCFISTGCLFGALNAPNPFPLFAVAFGIWAWFIWGCHRRSKKKAEQRNREQLFEAYMREQLRKKDDKLASANGNAGLKNARRPRPAGAPSASAWFNHPDSRRYF